MVKLPRRWNAVSIITLALLVIGIFYSIAADPLGWVLPIVLIGGIFLLYKYPPSTWGRSARPGQPNVKQNRTAPRQKPKSRTVPFRVINGGKDDNDDTPKYH
ncbi:hypothetical protein [Paenibacillus sp. NPDC058071]|uniref:hypothetical protein n=1 Tax=Paenibacillus sp. NPDC058071 TaxID=3346326 RepID=UPI0036DEF039